MLGLGEQVKGLDGGGGIPGLVEFRQIPYLGGWVAGNVNDFSGAEGEQLGQEFHAAPFPGRVDHHGGFFRGEIHPGENGPGVRRQEFRVFDSVAARVAARPVRGSLTDFHAQHFFKFLRQAQGEQAGTAVSVHQEFLPVHTRLLGHVIRKKRKNERIILKKVPRQKMELQIAHPFARHGVVIGDDGSFRSPEQNGGSPLEPGRGLVNAFAGQGQGFIDALHGNRALRHVHHIPSGASFQKTDGRLASFLRFVKVGRNLGAVMILAGRGYGRINRQFQPCLQAEQIRYLPGFPEKLAVIGKVLVLASSAGAEQATSRFHAVLAGVNYFHQIGGGVVFVITPDAGFDTVSRQGEGDETHPSVHASDAVARIGKGVNIQFKLLVVGKRFGVEAFGNGRSHGGGKRLWGGRGNQLAVQIVQQGFRQPGGAQSGAEIARQDSWSRSGLFILILWKNLLLRRSGSPGCGMVRRGGLFRLNGWNRGGGLRRRFLVGGAGIGPGQPGNQTGADQELSHGADSYSFIRTWQVNSPAMVHVKGISFFPETGKRLLFDYPGIVSIVGTRMRPFLFLCCSAVVSGLFAPQAGIAQQRPPIFGFANKNRIPEVNKSGSPVFDKLRNEAMKKKLPLVIYLTGSSWCSRCNIFTREYIKKTNFKNAAGKKFIFWLVDTKQVPGNSPGTFKFKMVPEEAAKIVGCVDSPRAPYVVLGPPAVFIIDPVSGELIKSLFTKSEVDKYGKPLAGIIEEAWNNHVNRKKLN